MRTHSLPFPKHFRLMYQCITISFLLGEMGCIGQWQLRALSEHVIHASALISPNIPLLFDMYIKGLFSCYDFCCKNTLAGRCELFLQDETSKVARPVQHVARCSPSQINRERQSKPHEVTSHLQGGLSSEGQEANTGGVWRKGPCTATGENR